MLEKKAAAKQKFKKFRIVRILDEIKPILDFSLHITNTQIFPIVCDWDYLLVEIIEKSKDNNDALYIFSDLV